MQHTTCTDNINKGIVFLSAEADKRLTAWLEEQDLIVRSIHTEGIVATPVSCHPDMFMCKLGIRDDAGIVMYWEEEPAKKGVLEKRRDAADLMADYPQDIAYNAACTGEYFIHNLQYTAPDLLEAAKAAGMTLVHVRQGYAKCSTVIVDETSIITYDQGLGDACRRAGMEVLLIEPGHVALPGYATGFIGGTSGRIGDTLVFHGDLSAHPDGSKIIEFIEKRDLKVKYFKEWPLTDIGSIIYYR